MSRRKPGWVNPTSLPKTGWPPGMLQDDSSAFSRWLATRGNARQLADQAAARIRGGTP